MGRPIRSQQALRLEYTCGRGWLYRTGAFRARVKFLPTSRSGKFDRMSSQLFCDTENSSRPHHVALAVSKRGPTRDPNISFVDNCVGSWESSAMIANWCGCPRNDCRRGIAAANGMSKPRAAQNSGKQNLTASRGRQDKRGHHRSAAVPHNELSLRHVWQNERLAKCMVCVAQMCGMCGNVYVSKTKPTAWQNMWYVQHRVLETTHVCPDPVWKPEMSLPVPKPQARGDRKASAPACTLAGKQVLKGICKNLQTSFLKPEELA